MKVRLAALGDYRVCADIHLSARAQMAYLPSDLHTAEETREWMRDVVFRSERVWVAEHAGRIVGYASAGGELLKLARIAPKVVNAAPCQEVVLTGDDVDLGMLPVIKCWPLDAGKYITLPLVCSYDPNTGKRNVTSPVPGWPASFQAVR